MHPVTISHPSSDATAENEAWVKAASVKPSGSGGNDGSHDESRLGDEEVAGRGR